VTDDDSAVSVVPYVFAATMLMVGVWGLGFAVAAFVAPGAGAVVVLAGVVGWALALREIGRRSSRGDWPFRAG